MREDQVSLGLLRSKYLMGGSGDAQGSWRGFAVVMSERVILVQAGRAVEESASFASHHDPIFPVRL